MPRGVANIHPIVTSRASGAIVEDVDGNRLIDFATGISVLNVGHTAPEVVAAIQRQAELDTHSCFHVTANEPYIELAERLNELAPGDLEKKTMFANSGAEAVENAVKIARRATGRQAIVTFDHAFHGRTLLAMSLTAKTMPYKQGFGPFAPEVYRLPFAYPYRCPCGGDTPEAFDELVEAWYSEVGGTIISQFRDLGASLDWSRLRFTMDAAYYRSVLTAAVAQGRSASVAFAEMPARMWASRTC